MAQVRYLISAYFHEDWRLDATSPIDVVRQFAEREPSDSVAAVRRGLSDLLTSGRSEADLRRLVLDEWQSSYDPALEAGTVRGWLEEILCLLA